MLMYLSMMMFMSGLLVYSMKYKHLLLMLLSLEFVVLSLYLYMNMIMSLGLMDFFFLMVFLTFSVCEGALGLSMMISMIRMHGNDYIMNLTFLW
uniref:NADH-ubiquinone oxidoreductase chain 4L n=1 Tax=Cucujoidea sp. 15 KM-2017 TaxID=2219351 RepID=A0A346RH49_9CUCU|nr:NADH dehydrogenase subunit 4L [Cucujoidea sp. 15 KM-2017]